MSLDIVIVNWRTPEDLEACWRSLDKNPPTVPFVATTVDVQSMPGGGALVAGWARGRANRAAMGHPNNIGYGRACNMGGAWGSGDVVACFNADVLFRPGVLDACHDALLKNDSWGVLGPRQVDQSGAITHAGVFGTNTQPTIRGWKSKGRDSYMDVRDDAVSVSGSAYFIKRQVWDELRECDCNILGPFLETPHYYEETWVSYHARAHGWKVVYWGRDTMVHKWHRASPVGGEADKQMPKSREIFRRACSMHSPKIACD